MLHSWLRQHLCRHHPVIRYRPGAIYLECCLCERRFGHGWNLTGADIKPPRLQCRGDPARHRLSVRSGARLANARVGGGIG